MNIQDKKDEANKDTAKTQEEIAKADLAVKDASYKAEQKDAE